MPDANGAYWRPNALHRVNDSQPVQHITAWRVDVEVNLRLVVVSIQKEQLGDQAVGDLRRDGLTIEAMRLGMQLLQEKGSFDQPRNRALVIFTDGEPDDARKLTLGQYFNEISEFIQTQVKPKVDVFVIGIDAVGQRWSATVPYWRRIVGDEHVFTIPNMSALEDQFDAIVERLFDLPGGYCIAC